MCGDDLHAVYISYAFFVSVRLIESVFNGKVYFYSRRLAVGARARFIENLLAGCLMRVCVSAMSVVFFSEKRENYLRASVMCSFSKKEMGI